MNSPIPPNTQDVACSPQMPRSPQDANSRSLASGPQSACTPPPARSPQDANSRSLASGPQSACSPPSARSPQDAHSRSLVSSRPLAPSPQSACSPPSARRRLSGSRQFTQWSLAVLATSTSLLAAAAPAATAPAAPAATITPQQMIGSMEATFGLHPGQRRNHIKGTCAAGEFVGTAEAATLSRSPVFSGKPIPVVARFSLGGGDAPDAAPAPRGMALELSLPGGSLQHFTMINVPIFAASSPASFRDFIDAARPDPKTGAPDPEKLKAYFASHPDAKPLADLAAQHTPTANYYQTPYFGIHTFKLIDAKGVEHLVKWSFVPRDGVKEMTPAQMKAAPHDFLEKNLIDRTKKGPAVWDMIVYVGEPGDPQDNPTLAWPETRKHFKAGTLTISQATPQKGAACEKINFDPLIMSDGIGPTNDPILLFRSPAYAVSFAKRLTGQ